MYRRENNCCTGVAVNVVAGDEQVVDAFEQRIVDHPRGLWIFADETLDDRCAVEVAEDGECGVLIHAAAVPDHVER